MSLRALSLLCATSAISALGVLAAPRAALAADPECHAVVSGSTTQIGDPQRVPVSAPFALDLVCTGVAAPISYGIEPPAHGTLIFPSPGHAVYTPVADYVGPDTFAVTGSDDLTPPMTTYPRIQIRLNVGDHAPTCVGSSSSPVLHGYSTSTSYTCSDVDGDPFTVSIVGQPAHGSAVLTSGTGLGTFVAYNSSPSFSGTETVLIAATETNDPTVTSNIAAVTFPVANTAPACTPTTASTDTVTADTFAIACFDTDSDPLTVKLTTAPRHGTIEIDDMQATYTPTPGYVGPDSATFTASDGIASAASVVSIRVTRPVSAEVDTAGIARVRRGLVSIGISCPRTMTTSCAGTATLTASVRGHRRSLGSGRLTIAAGKLGTARINVRRALAGSALRVLAGRTVRVTVSFRTRNSARRLVTVVDTILLHVPARR
jgi:hypothetical protein